jgi:hypothetical protein
MWHQVSPTFQRLAESVTVRDVYQPFAFTWDVDSQGTSERALLRHYIEKRGQLSSDPVLLTACYSVPAMMRDGDGLPVGIYFPAEALRWRLWDEELSDNEGDALDDGATHRVTELHNYDYLSADRSIRDILIEGVGAYGLVVDQNRLAGVMTPECLFSAPGRMCFLALALELEAAALDLCRLFPHESFSALQPDRRRKALEIFKRNSNTPDTLNQSIDDRALNRLLRSKLYGWHNPRPKSKTFYPLFLEHTMMSDKARMVTKCKLTIDVSNSHIKKVFHKAERLRNLAAHPSDESASMPMDFSSLCKTVREISELIHTFSESFARECRVRKATPSVP